MLLKGLVACVALGVLVAGCGEQSPAPKGEQPASSKTEPAISAKDAAQHEGKTITVCGTVSSARYLGESTGRPGNRNPTFLNFGGRFPNHDFSGVIFEDNREKFGEPEKTCLNKEVCITGKIQMFRNKPEMILTEPGQLKGC